MGNHKKSELLGMDYSTACAKLRKSIMLSLAMQLGKDECYRCLKSITDVDDFSIEHKDPWMQSSNPVQSFFDLDNIAFSHIKCNISAGTRPNRKYETADDRKRSGANRWYSRNRENIRAHRRKMRAAGKWT